MTSMMFSQDEFLEACKAETDFTTNHVFELGAERFLRLFYDDVIENEFLDYNLEECLELARTFWMSGVRRDPGETLISMQGMSGKMARHDGSFICIVTDDKAFLVDSIVNTISAFGIDVLGLFHPIISGSRDEQGRWSNSGTAVSESMILVVIPRQEASQTRRIETAIRDTLNDVTLINKDFHKLTDRVRACANELVKNSGDLNTQTLNEAVTFLNWIADGNFVLLGARRYNFKPLKNSTLLDYVNAMQDTDSALGVLRDKDVFVLRQTSEPSVIASNAQAFIDSGEPVTVEKSNLFSRVHRRVRMDYISVKHYETGQSQSRVIGETRFVGLFTSGAYSQSAVDIPLIRRKVEHVLQQSDAIHGSHNAKALAYVLDTYPRDELFQISTDDLQRIATGISQAYDRPRPRLFVRHDQFDRFVSALVYVPKEHYNPRLRERIGEYLKSAYKGRISAFYPQYSDAPMARVHFIIGLTAGIRAQPDVKDIETEIARMAQPWFDGVKLALEQRTSNHQKIQNIRAFKSAFSTAYQYQFSANETANDIDYILQLNAQSPVNFKVYEREGDEAETLRMKLYSQGERIAPSRIMPMLNHFDLYVEQETGYAVSCSGKEVVWIHDFELKLPYAPEPQANIATLFEQACMAIWYEVNEDDDFNRLILRLSTHWRDIAFIRLLARYRRQSGLDPSEAVQIDALVAYPEIARGLIALKTAKFDPAAFTDFETRKTAVTALLTTIDTALEEVVSLDHDRVLRRMKTLVEAALRTNFYQLQTSGPRKGQPKAYISLKISSPDVGNLPDPIPYREIYVSSPEVEGVHLRFGSVARGGLRWSDRRDDFRTEVLGLVKAQQVKNSVIVPVGSKGGFYPKKLPTHGSRKAVTDAAIEAYKMFISSLLDLTDNYKGAHTVPPENVVCWDDPDPYLVVAADKGTATFSDIANSVSKAYGFWLDDAFASGGSVGYDHKAMGITARGAWEAVKRHFREIGTDIQNEDFTVIGCGDMSGDVFGNGMLLSKHIRLRAAFDHRDIFIDPNPNVAKSFKERQRLYDTPSTSWADYNPKLISAGGGVFSRSLKSITLTDEMRQLLGVRAETLTPDEFIQTLLKADTDLLWFGGIGTYIKATHETVADVADKANDNIRVNACDVKAKVVGEGANLGVTQAGRVEYAMSSGRINSDAIDNAAGVDTSDHEVNIKILLSGAIEQGALKASERETLLESMTDGIAALVLQHNYDQTGALSLAQYLAREDHPAYERLMLSLEASGDLDRNVAGLPDTLEMQDRLRRSKPLTRPEISVLMAMVKNTLFEALVATDIADDPYTETILLSYFPKAVQKFESAMSSHRLRREIISSRIANEIVDVAGPLFVMRLIEQTDARPKHIARAFLIAYETLHIRDYRAQISALDTKVTTQAQLQLQAEIVGVLRRVVSWLVRRNVVSSLSEHIDRRDKALKKIDKNWLSLLSPYDRKRAETRIKHFEKAGIPKALAMNIALLRSRASGFDIIELSEAIDWDIKASAELFYTLGSMLKIDRVRAIMLNSRPENHWEMLSFLQSEEDFFSQQAHFARIAAHWGELNPKQKNYHIRTFLHNWLLTQSDAKQRYDSVVNSMLKDGAWGAAKLSILSSRMREFLSKYM